MALPASTQAKYWGIAAAVFFVALWYLGDVVLPFILGGAIAYFLDPVADRLEAWSGSRVLATVIITLVGLLVFIVAVLAVVPLLVQQTAALVDTAPSLFARLRDFLSAKFPFLVDEDSVVRDSLIALGQRIQQQGGAFLTSVLSSALSFINVLILLIIVPVVSFYMLLDWDRLVAAVDDLLPLDYADDIRQLAREIDQTMSSFIRGVGTVSLTLGAYYAIALMLAGLNFGLVVGAIAGMLTFIPYVGALIGGALAIGLAMFQFWGEAQVVDGETVVQATNWLRIAIVAGIFFLGQFLEGNILTPKLVGSSIGLHPVWLMFALSVFGSLFGFVGLLVAVPVAASLGVVARFFYRKYKGGRLYRGAAGKADEHGA